MTSRPHGWMFQNENRSGQPTAMSCHQKSCFQRLNFVPNSIQKEHIPSATAYGQLQPAAIIPMSGISSASSSKSSNQLTSRMAREQTPSLEHELNSLNPKDPYFLTGTNPARANVSLRAPELLAMLAK